MNTADTSFPKILFVNDFSPDARPLGDLLRQLLLGYPVEKIAWWHCRQSAVYDQPDLKAGTVFHFTLPRKLEPHHRWTKTKSWVLENLWVPRAARHLRQTVREAKPDVVWVLLNGWPGITAATAGLQNVRLHVSLWDYQDANSGIKMLGAERAGRFMKKTFEFIKRADTYDTLCPGSMEEIHLQTGRKDGMMVHSGFEPNHLRALENTAASSRSDDDIIRLAYAGTIISEKGFLAMLGALEKIRRTFPRKIVLEFFGGRNYAQRDWFKPEWMTEHGLFTDQGLIDALGRCSWGIVVMDPEGEDLHFSRFSFPNKVGSYLSSGVPVLGYGHPQSCLGVMMRDHRFGCFTSTTDPGALEKFLVDSLQIPAPREFFRDDMLRSAKTEFNAADMRARIWRKWGVRPS